MEKVRRQCTSSVSQLCGAVAPIFGLKFGRVRPTTFLDGPATACQWPQTRSPGPALYHSSNLPHHPRSQSRLLQPPKSTTWNAIRYPLGVHGLPSAQPAWWPNIVLRRLQGGSVPLRPHCAVQQINARPAHSHHCVQAKRPWCRRGRCSGSLATSAPSARWILYNTSYNSDLNSKKAI